MDDIQRLINAIEHYKETKQKLELEEERKKKELLEKEQKIQKRKSNFFVLLISTGIVLLCYLAVNYLNRKIL